MKTDYQIIRESKGYSRAQWAAKFNIPLRTIYHLENETREPGSIAKAFYRLARKFIPKRKAERTHEETERLSERIKLVQARKAENQ